MPRPMRRDKPTSLATYGLTVQRQNGRFTRDSMERVIEFAKTLGYQCSLSYGDMTDKQIYFAFCSAKKHLGIRT